MEEAFYHNLDLDLTLYQVVSNDIFPTTSDSGKGQGRKVRTFPIFFYWKYRVSLQELIY